MRAGVRLLLLVPSCLLLLATTPDTEQPLSGYSAASSRVERDWEGKFRALPEAAKPARLHAAACLAAAPRGLALRQGQRRVDARQVQGMGPGRPDRELRRPVSHAEERVPSRCSSPPSSLRSFRSRRSTSTPPRTSRPSSSRPTTPIPSMATSPRRSFMSTTALPDDYETGAPRHFGEGRDRHRALRTIRGAASSRRLRPSMARSAASSTPIPRDDGYVSGRRVPRRARMRPNDGVQRGSVMDMPLYPGDPLTPGVGATADAKRLRSKDAPTITKIPVLPISYADAQPLLAALTGRCAPDGWRGALPIRITSDPDRPRFISKCNPTGISNRSTM